MVSLVLEAGAAQLLREKVMWVSVLFSSSNNGVGRR